MAASGKGVAIATKPADTAKALDGGWAWVIVFGVGLSFAISVGFSKSYTLIYQELLVIFGQSDFATSWVAALFGSMKMFTGPLVSSLCNLYGHKRVTIAGGVLSFVAGVCSAFAPSLPLLYVSHGFLGGFGANLMITPSYSLICMYFDKKRGIANALATSSLAVGGAVFAPLITWLLQEYGYTGTMLTCAALFLHFCVSGSLYRPLEDNFPKQRAETEDCLLNGSERVKDDETNKNDVETPSVARKQHPDFRLDEKCSIMGSMRNLQLEGCESMVDIHKAHKQEEVHIKGENEGGTSSKSTLCGKLSLFVASLNLHLLKDWTFLLFCFFMSSAFFSFYMNVIFLSGVTRERGLTTQDTAILLITLNCFDCPARLLSGPLFDSSFVKKHMVWFEVGLCFCNALCLSLVHFMDAGWGLYICWVGCQIASSIAHSQHTNVLATLVPAEHMTSAVGLMRFIQGIGMIASPTLGGYIKDVTGIYSYSYLVAGGVVCLFSTVFSVYYGLTRTSSCNKQQLELDVENSEQTV